MTRHARKPLGLRRPDPPDPPRGSLDPTGCLPRPGAAARRRPHPPKVILLLVLDGTRADYLTLSRLKEHLEGEPFVFAAFTEEEVRRVPLP